MEKVDVKKPINESGTRRENFLMGFVGTNKVGKSHVAVNIAELWSESRPDDTIIAFDPQNKFRHIANYIIDIEDEEWIIKCKEYHNCLLILDDYRLLVREDKSPKHLDGLLYNRGFNNMDIIYICHSPALIHNIFTYLTTHYYIFHTLATDGTFKKKIPNYHLCVAAANEVNKYVKTNGRGKHPLDPEYKGQGFPYVMIDTERQTSKAYNQNKKAKNLE